MKNLKKIFAVIMAITMLAALSVTAFAADGTAAQTDNGSITVSNAYVGEEYNVYRLFDLESFVKDGAYSYKINSAWSGFFAEGAVGNKYIAMDGEYVTLVENADVAALAADALTFAEATATKIAPVETKTATVSEGVSTTTTTLTFTELPLGYYLIDSSVGTLLSLTTTDTSATVSDKNTIPEVHKQVLEQTGVDAETNKPKGTWGEHNTVDIGDTVYYKTTIKAKKGAVDYVLHDAMEPSLTFNADSVVVTVGDTKLTAGTDYTLVTSLTCASGANCDFHIEFANTYLATLTADTDIVVEYNAVLNENAEIYEGSNENRTALKYGNNSFTQWDIVYTYTFEFELAKTASLIKGDNDNATTDDYYTRLYGAEFKLYSSETGGTAIEFYHITGATGYKVATQAQIDADTNITDTITVGFAEISGLDAGVYYLEETVAPTGYNKLTERIKVDLTSDSATAPGKNLNFNSAVEDANTLSYDKAISGGIHVINKAGSILPGTGGIGTTVIYIIGAAMVITAIVLLVTKKRMKSEN